MNNLSMIKLTCFLFLFSFFSNLAWAQAPKDNFVHFTEKDGLPSNTILTICQDRYGYLWVGTLNGLVRYDGYNFKNYFQDIQDPNSLQIDVVYSIYEDSEGTLWIGGISRFAKYNRNTDNFTNYNLMEYQNDSTGTVLTVHSFCEDDESNLLLGIGPFDWGNARESIFTFNKKTETIKKYNFKKPVITNNIFSCLKTKTGQIWFAGLSGLIRLNQKQLISINPEIQRQRTISQSTPLLKIQQEQSGLVQHKMDCIRLILPIVHLKKFWMRQIQVKSNISYLIITKNYGWLLRMD